jgi:glycosyltransferase involved in cell wall biosynthesis
MRILIVTPSVPYPPKWGFGIRVYQMVRYLAERHQVSVLCYAGPHDHEHVAALSRTGASVHTVVREPPVTGAKRRSQLTSLLSPASFQRQGLDSMAMRAAIKEILAAHEFDVIQIESSQMSAFDFGNPPLLLLDEHNIEYELLYRAFKTERSLLRKLYNAIEYQKFRREEQRSWRRADGCILTSDREQVILKRHAPEVPTLVVPNGVDVDYFRPRRAPTDPNAIVFMGVMHYRPNVDAALFFGREILPRILRKRPDARFVIVGGGAPDELRRLAGPHLILTEEVPDTRPYVSGAGVFVVPLRMGSGTRLKVLEGLAMGRPLVSTSLGCEGIAAVHGEHLLVADDADLFSRQVLHVLEDADLAATLGRNGRALVEGSYSWPSVIAGLETYMLQRSRVRPASASSLVAPDRAVHCPPLAG